MLAIWVPTLCLCTQFLSNYLAGPKNSRTTSLQHIVIACIITLRVLSRICAIMNQCRDVCLKHVYLIQHSQIALVMGYYKYIYCNSSCICRYSDQIDCIQLVRRTTTKVFGRTKRKWFLVDPGNVWMSSQPRGKTEKIQYSLGTNKLDRLELRWWHTY